MILGLREFTHLRWDPRILIVDSRERRSARDEPLDNRFFAWIRVAETSEAERLASDLCQRHLIIVHEDEERALDLDHVFRSLEINSCALEGGEDGWRQAIIEEQWEQLGRSILVTMNQLSIDRREYIIVRDRRAVVIQPTGSIAAIREIARHHGALHVELLERTGFQSQLPLS